jgi:hypothetical protein
MSSLNNKNNIRKPVFGENEKHNISTKPYETPTLLVHGTITALTRALGGEAGDLPAGSIVL